MESNQLNSPKSFRKGQGKDKEITLIVRRFFLGTAQCVILEENTQNELAAFVCSINIINQTKELEKLICEVLKVRRVKLCK